jgi:GAF domain-containing protein
MGRTILCVDEVASLEETGAAIESAQGYSVIEATSVEEAIAQLDEESVDAVVTEYDLSDGRGLDVIDHLRDVQPQTPAVLFTDARPSNIDTGAVEEVIVEYVSKETPDARENLVPLLRDLIQHSAQVGFLRPDDEEERLEALEEYDVENLELGESFDRLTDLIASHFDVAVTFIGLVEENEENFLACTGADWDSLTREDTICTHSMLHEDVMVVEDITADSRFSSNETLLNLGIRSYAGANMTTPSGEIIGQVCVIDHEPRSFSAQEQAELQQFAEEAMEQLELRQRLQDAREVQDQ